MHNTLLRQAREIQLEGRQAREEQHGRTGGASDPSKVTRHSKAKLMMCIYIYIALYEVHHVRRSVYDTM